MSFDKALQTIAKLLADNTRASIMALLMDGRAFTAGEIAFALNISPQVTSNQLKKLLYAKLVRCEQSGRHRYYGLYDQAIANYLENLSLLGATPINQPQHHHIDADLIKARTCYDHIAGQLGVEITNKLIHANYLSYDNYLISINNRSADFFQNWCIDIQQLQQQKRIFIKSCLDFSERRHHIGGALGAAILDCFLKQRFVTRSKKHRVLTLTAKGKMELASF